MILYLSKYIRNFDVLCVKFCGLGIGILLMARFTSPLFWFALFNWWNRRYGFCFPESGENRFKSKIPTAHQSSAVCETFQTKTVQFFKNI